MGTRGSMIKTGLRPLLKINKEKFKPIHLKRKPPNSSRQGKKLNNYGFAIGIMHIYEAQK